MKYIFLAAMISYSNFIVIPQAVAAPPGRCTAEVLYSEELPYGPIGSWLVRADMKIIPSSRDHAFVATFVDYVPSQTSVRRGDTFRFSCGRLETHSLRLLDLMR